MTETPFTILADQKFRARDSFPIRILTHWNTPFTGGYEATLPARAEFVIAFDPVPGATAVGANLVDPDSLHSHFVPQTDRDHPLYAGYSLSVDLDSIHIHCQIIA